MKKTTQLFKLVCLSILQLTSDLQNRNYSALLVHEVLKFTWDISESKSKEKRLLHKTRTSPSTEIALK